MVDRPDPVVPHIRTEQSVFLRLDADQGEHIPTNRVHPGVKMFRTQPVADDSYQPLVTGPLGTNEMNAINDLGRPTAGGPLGRPFSLDRWAPGQCYPWATEISHQVWALWADRRDLNQIP